MKLNTNINDSKVTLNPVLDRRAPLKRRGEGLSRRLFDQRLSGGRWSGPF